MSDELGPKSVLPDMIHETLGEEFPELFGSDPYRCAICGEYIHSEVTNPEDIDLENPETLVMAVELPPETVELMEHSGEIDVAEDTESIRLQFCKHHLTALEDWYGKPGSVVFSSFDAQYVVQKPSDRPSKRNKWGQNRLRVARETVRGRELMSQTELLKEKELLQATLLVAAVDQYGFDYGPVERAKSSLFSEFRDRGFQVSSPEHGFLDVELNLPELSQRVLGSVFLLPSDDDRYEDTPLSKYEAGPERSVSNTRYYSIHRDNYYESAYNEFENVIYVGFYKLPERNSWIWYPFKEDYSDEFGSDDRQYLTVEGPTDSSPLLDLDDFGADLLDVTEYENRVEENWESIQQNRPATGRARDYIRKYLE